MPGNAEANTDEKDAAVFTPLCVQQSHTHQRNHDAAQPNGSALDGGIPGQAHVWGSASCSSALIGPNSQPALFDESLRGKGRDQHPPVAGKDVGCGDQNGDCGADAQDIDAAMFVHQPPHGKVAHQPKE